MTLGYAGMEPTTLAFGLMGYTGPLKRLCTRYSKMRKPMLLGSREAPITATPLGLKKGRIEATVAIRSRISKLSTLSRFGKIEKLTST